MLNTMEKCMFNFARDCQSVSHSDSAIVHIPAVSETPVAPHPPKQLILSIFGNVAILVGV